jgi:NAD(P)-dependent dehydrogenase (short-subunit alcohol dehydrogenase family)
MEMPRALITGGSMGIGLAVARRLAGSGWTLTLVARGAEALKAAAGSLPGAGHRALPLDVGDWDAWASVGPDIGELDGVVHAAAVITPIGAATEVDPKAFLDTLRINVGGLFFTARAAQASLAASGGGFVAFAGGGATGPQPRFDAYAASKAATVRLVENLARDGMRINAISPGFVNTRMAKHTVDAGREAIGDSVFDRTLADIEKGGVSPERAAALAELLLSPRTSDITGKIISAPWDPWEDESFLRKLAEDPELATVRRIDDQFFGRILS